MWCDFCGGILNYCWHYNFQLQVTFSNTQKKKTGLITAMGNVVLTLQAALWIDLLVSSTSPTRLVTFWALLMQEIRLCEVEMGNFISFRTDVLNEYCSYVHLTVNQAKKDNLSLFGSNKYWFPITYKWLYWATKVYFWFVSLFYFYFSSIFCLPWRQI